MLNLNIQFTTEFLKYKSTPKEMTKYLLVKFQKTLLDYINVDY